MRLHRLLPLVALLFSPAVAAVCPAEPDGRAAQLGMITRNTPLYSETAADGNPCRRTGQCGSRGHLIAGDVVVVHARAGGWACVEFTSVQGRPTFQKAIPLNTLKVIQQPSTPVGSWKFGDQTLFFRRSGSLLLVRGWAQWPWEMDASPETRRKLLESGPNTGHLDLSTPWSPGQVSAEFRENADSEACTVNSRALGPYLLVTDNNRCGGHNVTFSGLYRQTSKTVSEKDWQDAALP